MINLLSGVQINGGTIEVYCAMSKNEKIAFIVKHCKVSEKVAKDFVEKPLIHEDGKSCCGGHKHKENESKGSIEENTTAAEPVNTSGNGEGGGSKRKR